jgi:hypothetical protein
MSQSKTEVLQDVIEFINLITAGTDGSESQGNVTPAIRAFQRRLSMINEDTENEQTRPFLLIHAAADNILPESMINAVLIAAADAGLDGEFCKTRVHGNIMGFFSHRARTFVDDYVANTGIAYMNLLSNGIAFEDYQCIGFYSASAERLTASKIEAQQCLKAQ